MNCPVCNRNNAFNLSICPSCGAMMHDTVREELLPKVSVSRPLKMDVKSAASARLNRQNTIAEETTSDIKNVISEVVIDAPSVISSADDAATPKQTTSGLAAKPTNPTLVEFHSKNSNVPEWRLQLQNVVRRRHDRENSPSENSSAAASAAVVSTAAAPRQTKFARSGAANALKIETIDEKKPVAIRKNPTLNSALERIEKSRRKFLAAEEEQQQQLSVEPVISAAPPRPATKNFPFYIASKQGEAALPIEQPQPAATSANIAAKLTLTTFLKKGSGDLDTNKLPALRAAPLSKTSTNFDEITIENPKIETLKTETAKPETIIEVKKTVENKTLVNNEIAAESVENAKAESEENLEEFEDSAPFSLRFNAALFDLIIGAFLSLLLLAPFMLAGENSWLNFTGLLAFLATCSIVMFIYLTTTIGFYGRTFGMRLFSLEVVDIEGENYPTLHQAAVSSAIYLLSLAFGGVGFLTLLFNDERRAAHDLISGTIVVKEN
jgi:uncharacterized RDD family membrane protein YckC